jgi:hypothetical protein
MTIKSISINARKIKAGSIGSSKIPQLTKRKLDEMSRAMGLKMKAPKVRTAADMNAQQEAYEAEQAAWEASNEYSYDEVKYEMERGGWGYWNKDKTKFTQTDSMGQSFLSKAAATRAFERSEGIQSDDFF